MKEVRRQIQKEVDASLTYLAMGAHFAQDTINRPGFSEFFLKAAGEEREHATKLIEYLLMRGQLVSDVSALIRVNVRQMRLSNTSQSVADQFSHLFFLFPFSFLCRLASRENLMEKWC